MNEKKGNTAEPAGQTAQDANTAESVSPPKPDIRTCTLSEIAAYLNRDLTSQERLVFVTAKYQAQRDDLLYAAKQILSTEPMLSGTNFRLLRAAIKKAEPTP